MATALIRPHALSAREQRVVEMPEGLTLAQMVALVWPMEVAQGHAVVFVGAERVSAEHWARVRPKAGAMVRIGLTLAGGGGGGKQMLGMVAMIAISVFAPYAAGTLMGLQAGTLAYSVAVAGITIAGALAVQALFKPPALQLGRTTDPAESSTYSLSGQSNQATPYAPVLRVYGTHRIFPRTAAAPFVASEGPNQFLYMLLDCGYGPLDVQELRIGDTSFANYRDMQFAIHPSWKAGDPLTLYRNDVAYESLNVTLKTDTPEIRVSAQDASNISLEFACPRGLVAFDDRGNRQPHHVDFSVYIRPAGSGGAWTPVASLPVQSSRTVTSTVSVAPVTALPEDTVTWYGGGAQDYEHHGPGFAEGRNNLKIRLYGSTLAVGDTLYFANAPYLVSAIAPLAGGDLRASINPPLRAQLVGQLHQCPVTRPTSDQIVVTDATAQPVYFSISFDVAPGQWEIQCVRRSPESTNQQIIDQLAWLALRSSAARPPIATREAHTLIELKVRANDQLAGVLQNVNCIATSILRQWDGAAWIEAPTRNPAWAYLDALAGSAALRPLVDARIDTDSLIAWAAYCDAEVPNGQSGAPEPRVRFDHVVDYGSTTFALLQSIASAGRATPTVRDGRHGVIVDEEQAVPVQLFTPRNSWGFSARRVYITPPHGMRIKFIDPASWQEGEVLLYAPGFNAANAVTFEELKLFGVTRYSQATRDGRYLVAQAMLRREEFEIQCDIESLIATRGDLVAVQHDVLEVGGDSTRAQAFAGDELTVVDPFGVLPTERYGVRIRLRDGTITPPIEAFPIAADKFRLASVPAPAPAAGDLLAWGFLTTETGEYLVKNVAPGPDFSAVLSLAEVARGVYTADAGEIPPYVPPFGGRPALVPAPAPVNLRAVQLDRTIGREPYADVVLYWDAPGGAPYPKYRVLRVAPGGVETQIVETFTTSAQVDQAVRLLDVGALEQVTRYGVIGVDSIGKQSEPAFIDVQLRDPLFVPDAPEFLSSNVHDKTTSLTWLAPGSAANPGNGQVLYFEVRWVPADVDPAQTHWGAAARVTELVPWNVTTVTVPSRNGTYFVKSITASRVESELAALTVTAVEDLVVQDFYRSIRFEPEWRGLFDGVELDPLGRLILKRNPDGTFPPYGVFQSNERELFNQLLQCRISSRYEAIGLNAALVMAQWVPLAIADPIAGARRGVDWDVSLWVNSSGVAPYVMADWVPLASAAPLDPIPAMDDADWRPLIHGEYTGRQLFFALVLESTHPNVTPVVSSGGVDIDFPEREESHSDILVPAAGMDFLFARPFVFPPSVAIDLQAAAPGDFVQRGPVGTGGLRIDVKNGGLAVAGVVDINAFGVGRLL